MSTQAPQDNIPWWQKYGARGVGTGGGIIALIIGVFNCISFSPLNIVAAIWLMLAAFIVISAEAPCCCMFVEFVQKYSQWVESRPHWQKGAFYIIISLPSMIIYPGVTIILGSLLIFGTGVCYGLLALGKKGSRQDMMAAATTTTQGSVRSGKDVLVDAEQPPATA